MFGGWTKGKCCRNYMAIQPWGFSQEAEILSARYDRSAFVETMTFAMGRMFTEGDREVGSAGGGHSRSKIPEIGQQVAVICNQELQLTKCAGIHWGIQTVWSHCGFLSWRVHNQSSCHSIWCTQASWFQCLDLAQLLFLEHLLCALYSKHCIHLHDPVFSVMYIHISLQPLSHSCHSPWTLHFCFSWWFEMKCAPLCLVVLIQNPASTWHSPLHISTWEMLLKERSPGWGGGSHL